MTTRTVVGTWRQANQTTPAVGKILFQPVSRVVTSGAYIALPSPLIVATLNNQGSISVSLPITDEGEPEGWLYRVIEQLGHGSARYYIEVPAGASALDLSTVVPVEVANGGPAYTAFTPQSRTITAGTGLTGGGDLSANRTLSIAAGGVGTTQLADDAVTADKLAPNSVTSDAIAPGVVVESDVADASISTAKVQDAAITTGKLSAGVNTSLGLADGSAQKSANLSDLASASAARTNLGLGSAATTDATAYATSAQGTKADGAAQKASNLSDLASASSARTNLGLGTAATTAASDYATAAQGAKADTAVQPSRTVSAGTGMTGGGDLSADRTLAIASGGVGATQLASDSVTLAKLADNSSLVVAATAPASPKIGTVWVDSSATVDTMTWPVGSSQIADSAVTSAKIADGTITNSDINASAAIAASKVSGTAVVMTDLPYTWTMAPLTPPTGSNCTVLQGYLSGSISNYNILNSSAAVNDYFEWRFLVASGTYTLRVAYRAGTSAGILTIAVNGSNLGTTVDTYAAAAAYNNITDITGVTLAAGINTIRFTAASKNASSTAHQMFLHGFSVSRTGA